MGKTFSSWKRRFVKIEGDKLLTYTDDGPGAEFKGEVSLRATVCRLTESKGHAKGPQFRFETTDASGTSTSWAAFSREARLTWIHALANRGVQLDGELLLGDDDGGEDYDEEDDRGGVTSVSPSRRPSREKAGTDAISPAGQLRKLPRGGARSASGNQGHTRVLQCHFNSSVWRSILPEKASTLRELEGR